MIRSANIFYFILHTLQKPVIPLKRHFRNTHCLCSILQGSISSIVNTEISTCNNGRKLNHKTCMIKGKNLFFLARSYLSKSITTPESTVKCVNFRFFTFQNHIGNIFEKYPTNRMALKASFHTASPTNVPLPPPETAASDEYVAPLPSSINLMPNSLFVAIDMDGTLLASSRQVSQRNAKAFSLLRRNGHVPFLATGRSREGALSLISPSLRREMVYEDLFPGVFLNGARVFGFNGELIFSGAIPNKLLRNALNTLKELDLLSSSVVELDSILLCESIKNFPVEKFADIEPTPVVEASHDSFWNIEGSTKIIIYVKEEESKNLKQVLLNKLDPQLTCMICFQNLLEINLKSISKAYGINLLLNFYNVSNNKLMSIGDSDNDESMLQLATYSVAVDNATSRCKEIAKFLVRNCDEDAVADAVEKVLGIPV